MSFNYHNRKFRVTQNSENGEVSDDLIFEYQQEGSVLTCIYFGENILHGHLLGTVDSKGKIAFSYHQVNRQGELKTGICTSIPELLPNGKLRLSEKWQWTNGDQSKGTSTLEEL